MKLKGCGTPVNKREFRHRVWRKLKTDYKGHELRQDEVYWVVSAVLDCLVDIIRDGEYLQLLGYFSMYAKLYKEKIHYDFKHEAHIVPAHYSVKFVPHTLFKEACEELMEREDNISLMDDIDDIDEE